MGGNRCGGCVVGLVCVVIGKGFIFCLRRVVRVCRASVLLIVDIDGVLCLVVVPGVAWAVLASLLVLLTNSFVFFGS